MPGFPLIFKIFLEVLYYWFLFHKNVLCQLPSISFFKKIKMPDLIALPCGLFQHVALLALAQALTIYSLLSKKKKHCRSQWKALLLKASSSSNSILRLILQLPTELKTRWRSAKECPEKFYWEKKNVIKCGICCICGLSFLKQFGNICGSTAVGLKHLEHSLNYLKLFTKYIAQKYYCFLISYRFIICKKQTLFQEAFGKNILQKY